MQMNVLLCVRVSVSMSVTVPSALYVKTQSVLSPPKATISNPSSTELDFSQLLPFGYLQLPPQ